MKSKVGIMSIQSGVKSRFTVRSTTSCIRGKDVIVEEGRVML